MEAICNATGKLELQEKRRSEFRLSLHDPMAAKNRWLGGSMEPCVSGRVLQVKLYLYQLCRSLAHIHAMGICHRDIKLQVQLKPPTSHAMRAGSGD